jgi:hypothetical protein
LHPARECEIITVPNRADRHIRLGGQQDIHVGDGGELIYRTKIQLSFKYEQGL